MQCRHFPCSKKKKLIRGIRSCQAISRQQCWQRLGKKSESPDFARRTHTFAKDPKTAPIIKTKTKILTIIPPRPPGRNASYRASCYYRSREADRCRSFLISGVSDLSTRALAYARASLKSRPIISGLLPRIASMILLLSWPC